MIDSTWPYIAVLLLAAAIFPVLEARTRARVFEVLPPIVLCYLLVTALAVAGTWVASAEIVATQKLLMARLLPALIFLLLVNCDLRAIIALGPRVLATFVCAAGSILIAFVIAYLLMRNVLPADGWKALASVSASWTGGSANLVAVSQSIGADATAVSQALLTDALCYSVWVVVLFSTAPLAARFNRWSGAMSSVVMLDTARASRAEVEPQPPSPAAPNPGDVLLWLGLALVVGLLAEFLASLLPEFPMLTKTSWIMLITTVIGVCVGQTPLRKLPGAMPTSSALLLIVVAALASQGNFAGLASAPWFVVTGFIVLGLHAAMMLLCAKLFRFDLALCGIASLANIGGIASAPLLAATHSPALAPVAVLLAMLGYLIGTGAGIALALVLKSIAPIGAG